MSNIQKLSDKDLWLCLKEAEERKSNANFDIEVRIRSFNTYLSCLGEAFQRGYSYNTLKKAVKETKCRP